MTVHNDMKPKTYSVEFTESQWTTVMLAIWDSVNQDEKRYGNDKVMFWAVVDEKIALRDSIHEIINAEK
jgi:hypothetical protein